MTSTSTGIGAVADTCAGIGAGNGTYAGTGDGAGTGSDIDSAWISLLQHWQH